MVLPRRPKEMERVEKVERLVERVIGKASVVIAANVGTLQRIAGPSKRTKQLESTRWEP